MPYAKGVGLPAESASKLGHLAVLKSQWILSLVNDFERREVPDADTSQTPWQTFEAQDVKPLKNVWAVDGSYVTVSSEGRLPKEVSFVKTALLTIDQSRLDTVDKEYPHPLLLRDILKDSAVFHATVFPLKNVRTSLGSNYDAIRYIVRDSMRIDEEGAFYETLKWLAYRKWDHLESVTSPAFHCPHCSHHIQEGLPYDSDEANCPSCQDIVFLTDMVGFHLDMDEMSAPESVASAYMLVMEHLMLFTAIRLLWEHTDNKLVSEALFIKDGPLTLQSQYSKLVPNIRAFLEYAKSTGRPVHVIGQEKSGAFCDHLASIAAFTGPHSRGESTAYAALSHDYVRREVYRSPDLSNPYGSRTNWGEKLYVKMDPATYMVLNVPTGAYKDERGFPASMDLIGIDRILATIPGLVSHKFEGALFPIELANGIASMSSYPSGRILKRFLDEHRKSQP